MFVNTGKSWWWITYEPKLADKEFGLDGVEETVFYAMPVGKISVKDKEAENEFYAFVKEEGL